VGLVFVNDERTTKGYKNKIINHLYKLIIKYTVSVNLDKLLNEFLEMAVKKTGGDAGSIALLHPTGKKLIFPYFYNLPERLTRIDTTFGTGLSSFVIKRKKISYISDYSSYPLRVEEFVKEGVKSVLAIPLLYRKKSIGAIGIFTINRKKRFSKREVKFATIFSDIFSEYFIRFQHDNMDIYYKTNKNEKEKILTLLLNVADILSHEGNQPLRSISGFLDIIIEDFFNDIPAPVMIYLKKSKTSCERLAEVLDLIVNFITTVSIREKPTLCDVQKDFIECYKLLKEQDILPEKSTKDTKGNLKIMMERNKLTFIIRTIIVLLLKYVSSQEKMNVNLSIEKKGRFSLLIFSIYPAIPTFAQTIIEKQLLDALLKQVFGDTGKLFTKGDRLFFSIIIKNTGVIYGKK